MNYIAHRRNDGTEQSLSSHLEGTARLAAHFALAFDSDQAGHLAGLLHDIGKYSDYFQRRIRDPEHVPPHDHSTAGAKETGLSPLGFAIAGHHGGLPDGGRGVDSASESTLYGRLKRELDDYSSWRTEVVPPKPQFPSFLTSADRFTLAFYTRMLYSCLVDADFLDTESFMQGEVSRGSYETIPVLLERLNQYFSGWNPADTPLNQVRQEILDHCIQGSTKPQGLFSLTVPTGGGKTLSSLSFALRHAVTHGLERVIYVIPYTSIIDQTAQVFQSVLGADQVLEHHSGVVYENECDSVQHNMQLATENWDAPIIVTTAVQFFESLFSCKSSQCRKLHNIAKSVVIFDEAQTLPVPYLRPCVSAIAQLVKHYHTTAVLCTATQPELDKLFHEENLSLTELIPNRGELYQQLRRVTLKDRGTPTWTELGAELSLSSQSLCIVNRRNSAQQLYEMLPEVGRYCLTTLLCPYHRKAQLAEIRVRLAQGLPCRVVATSLVEAGVDLDFPTVYREKAGLDSILQAAGRCNREGKHSAAHSVVWYFQSEEGASAPVRQAVSVLETLTHSHNDLSTPQAIADYFQSLWYVKGDATLDVKGILPAFQKGIDGVLFPFRQVSKAFRLIESPTTTIYLPLGEGASLVKRLQYGLPSRSLYRKLGQYSLSVYPDHLKKLLQTGSVQVLDSGDIILCDLTLYNEKTGLALEVETGIGYFL